MSENVETRSGMNRRGLIKTSAAGAMAAIVGARTAHAADDDKAVLKGTIKHSACAWCYSMPLETLATEGAKLGLVGLDLIGPNDWPTLKKYGLVGTMTPTHGIGKGLNRIENHDECLAMIEKAIEQTAEAGWRNVICFSGNREGMDDEEGAKNCAIGLKKIAGLAEKKKVIINMELLNSKSHKDYMCDHTAFGVSVCKQVGSPNVKLLYDIYHMQRMEGDIIDTIKANIDYIGHIHTAGNPGRNELNEKQEINYPPIMQTIADLTQAGKFDGFTAHEFVPKRKGVEGQILSLKEAIAVCDV